jgi:hypothetical protein
MASSACLVCLVSTVSGHCKNTLRRASANSRHITNLNNPLFLDIYGHNYKQAMKPMLIWTMTCTFLTKAFKNSCCQRWRKDYLKKFCVLWSFLGLLYWKLCCMVWLQWQFREFFILPLSKKHIKFSSSNEHHTKSCLWKCCELISKSVL